MGKQADFSFQVEAFFRFYFISIYHNLNEQSATQIHCLLEIFHRNGIHLTETKCRRLIVYYFVTKSLMVVFLHEFFGYFIANQQAPMMQDDIYKKTARESRGNLGKKHYVICVVLTQKLVFLYQSHSTVAATAASAVTTIQNVI